jgi:hypothetical protein
MEVDYDNSCQNCGQCVCLSCMIKDDCGCSIGCDDKPLTKCEQKIFDNYK